MREHLPRLLRSAVTAYVVFAVCIAGTFVRAQVANEDSIRRVKQTATADAARATEVAKDAALKNCVTTQREWDTFDRLIAAAVHPPSQAGKHLTVTQRDALKAYQLGLAASIGPRPIC